MEHRERIEAAESDMLLRWGERIPTAKTIEEVFASRHCGEFLRPRLDPGGLLFAAKSVQQAVPLAVTESLHGL